jgi:CheY-like chemotaxis protein
VGLPRGTYATFCTLPDLMQEVQTRIRRLAPLTKARTFCKFRFQRRLVTLWAWLIRWPNWGPLPQTSQTCAIRSNCISARTFPATQMLLAEGLHYQKAVEEVAYNMSGSLGSTTVLVVEDAGPLCEMISSMLRDSGYNVLQAADGNEALSLLESQGDRIQLVLTDVVMPRMSGKELARRLSQMLPDLPVLFMSGYAEEPVLQGVSVGTLFLRKPFTAPVLIEAVRRVLARPTTQAQHDGTAGSRH